MVAAARNIAAAVPATTGRAAFPRHSRLPQSSGPWLCPDVLPWTPPIVVVVIGVSGIVMVPTVLLYQLLRVVVFEARDLTVSGALRPAHAGSLTASTCRSQLSGRFQHESNRPSTCDVGRSASSLSFLA